MKILIVTHYFQPHVGGIEIVAYNQAKELVKRGHQVTIVTSKIGDEPEQEVIDGIKVRRVRAWNILEKTLGVPYPIFSLRLYTVLKQEIRRCSIIHIHGALYLGSLYAALIGKRPLFMTEHVGFVPYKSALLRAVQRMAYWTLGRITLRRSRTVFYLNPDVKAFLSSQGVSEDRLHLLPNGVDTTLFRPASKEEKQKLRKKYGLPATKRIILFVGRFVEKKGFTKLYGAKDNSYLIVFVGEGNVPAHIVKNPNVRFMKFLPQEQLSEIYRAADVFCLPSQGEGFPLSIQEAMASGLPIVTTASDAYSAYLSEECSKMLHPKDNLHSTLKSQSSAQLKQMGKAAARVARKKFGWQKNIISLQKQYREVRA